MEGRPGTDCLRVHSRHVQALKVIVNKVGMAAKTNSQARVVRTTACK